MRHIVWDWNGALFDGALFDGVPSVAPATDEAFARDGWPDGTTPASLLTWPPADHHDRPAGWTSTGAGRSAADQHVRPDRARPAVADAVGALTAWRDAGRTQSLLSSRPHADLLAAARRADIARFFSHVDGLRTVETPGKAAHLRGHLAAVGVDAREVLVIGDRVDDLHAARTCGARPVLHRPDERVPVGRTGARDLGVPVARTLSEAIRWALDQRPGG
ncbi:HAD hydrolase-like protein [Saccharothrix sp. BKS2]|uniref:HAD family hydrolase n=1 Tax=Saccharothrix sp. BKS2 TaxID=3064400 RepID=UPI0039E73DA0